jgi:hypothetical protein
VASVLNVLVRYLHDEYTKSALYHENTESEGEH